MMLHTYCPAERDPFLVSLSQMPPHTPREDWLVLLKVQTIFVCTQLFLVLAVMVFAVVQPCALLRRLRYERQRRRYASFIFRRFLSHLDEAFGALTAMNLDENDEQQQQQLLLDGFLEGRERAELAMQLFRRDACKILYPTQDLLTTSPSELYFVDDDEEQEMAAAGFGVADVKVKVSDGFLTHLLYPEREVLAPTE